MMNDSNKILDDLLSRWHHRCMTFSLVQVKSADPAFKRAISPRGWDSLDEIHEDVCVKLAMDAIDFHVFGDEKTHQGGLDDPWCSAIKILARNLYTGYSVWLSPRLPKDPLERGQIIQQARGMLIDRLRSSGVM